MTHGQFLSLPEDDQDKAIALYIKDREACSSCGTSEKEWKRDKWAYTPEVRRCRGCELRGLQEDELHEKEGIKHGLQIVLVPRKE